MTAANPARLDETVTARMTGMGPVDDAGSTTVVFQWSLIEWYMPSHMGPAFWRTPLELIRSQATGEPGVYRVTVRLPQVFRFGISSCLGIDAAVAGGGFQRSLLPLRVP